MRNIALVSAGMLGALVMSLGGCAPAGAPESTAEAGYETASSDSSAKEKAELVRARNDAEDAQARAAQAEAKLQCERERQEASNKGAVVGGVAGAVIGSQVAGDGAKSEGGVLGGVAGVLTGRQIAKKDHRC